MKLVYEEGEKEILQKTHKELLESGRARLFDDSDIGKTFSVHFILTDPALASYILIAMLNNKVDIDMGIDVTGIDLSPAVDKNKIKEKLHKLIDEEIFG